MKREKHTGIELLFYRNTLPSICRSESLLSRLFPLFLSHSFHVCFYFSLVLSLCGILAAILALGSHLSFGGTHAFLLADGTPTPTHTHTLAKHTLSLTHKPNSLKDKKDLQRICNAKGEDKTTGMFVCNSASVPLHAKWHVTESVCV